jgi:hypothetical protein
MNSLYFASREQGRTATPVEITSELYKGHDIESEDTSCLRMKTQEGATVHFYVSLCSFRTHEPMFRISGSRGYIEAEVGGFADIYADNKLVHRIYTGRELHMNKVINSCRVVLGEEEPECPVSMTRSFVLAVNGAFEGAGSIHGIPEKYIKNYDLKITDPRCDERDAAFPYIIDIETYVEQAFSEQKLFSEINVPWARPSRPFSLVDYKNFNPSLEAASVQ